MTAEIHFQESPKGELSQEATTEEFSVVRKEGNRKVQRELEEDSVIRNFRITATEGKRDLHMPALKEDKDGGGA